MVNSVTFESFPVGCELPCKNIPTKRSKIAEKEVQNGKKEVQNSKKEVQKVKKEVQNGKKGPKVSRNKEASNLLSMTN